jgi:hypothetical protein
MPVLFGSILKPRRVSMVTSSGSTIQVVNELSSYAFFYGLFHHDINLPVLTAGRIVVRQSIKNGQDQQCE